MKGEDGEYEERNREKLTAAVIDKMTEEENDLSRE